MGWFDEQIKDRKRNDDDAFAEAFANMASAITGKKIEASLNNDRTVTKDAIDEILKYYHVKSREVPDGISVAEASSEEDAISTVRGDAVGAPFWDAKS